MSFACTEAGGIVDVVPFPLSRFGPTFGSGRVDFDPPGFGTTETCVPHPASRCDLPRTVTLA